MSIKKQPLPPIVIGTWALGDEYWGEQNHSDSLKTIHAAIRLGYNSFDTSPVYGKGRSEQLLGQQLKNNPDTIISTKSFIKPTSSVEKSLNNSLKRLNRDYVDYFFVHWPSSKEDCRPMIELLEKLRDQGKILKIGLSNFNKKQLITAQEAGKIDIIQNAFNFFWDKELDYIKSCKSQGILTQGYSPLGQGLLTGKFTSQTPYETKDLRYKMSLFNDNNLKVVYKYISKLQTIAEKNNTTIHNLVLKWMESLLFLDSIVIGCRKRYQIEDLTTLKNLKLTTNTLNEILNLSKEASNEINGGYNIFNHSY